MTTLDLVLNLMLLTAESIELHPEGSPARLLLEQVERDLKIAHCRCRRPTGTCKVAVVGLSNVGKSTLVNALLGLQISAVRNGPSTASIVEFEYGREWHIEAFTDSLTPENFSYDSPDDLIQELTNMVSHFVSESEKWRRLVVTLPCDFLAKGLVLVDTPGFGAAGENSHRDDQLVTSFLKEDAAQVFWVVNADQGIGTRERSLFTSHLIERCDDLIVTNAEDYSEKHREDWKKRYRPFLSLQTKIFFVSGKGANLARSNGDKDGWEKSGINELIIRIRRLAENPDSVDSVEQKINFLGAAVTKRLRFEDFERMHRPLFSKVAATLLLTRLPEYIKQGEWGNLLRGGGR